MARGKEGRRSTTMKSGVPSWLANRRFKTESVGKRPSRNVNPRPYCCALYPGCFSPLFQSAYLSLAFYFYCIAILPRTRSAIIGLLFWCGPSTIARFIVPVLIGISVYAFSLWASSHISYKGLKRPKPPRTDHNSTTAVIFICCIGGVKTSSFHVRPNMVGARSSTSRSSMFEWHRTILAESRLS